MSEVTKTFSKEFRDAVDQALVRVSSGGASTIVYRRAGKLDVRIRLDVTPPQAGQMVLVIEEKPA